LKYKILWADKKTQKSFQELSSLIQSRIAKSIKSLSSNPRPPGVKKLGGKLKGVWRIRIGDYRLLYDIDDKSKEIFLLDLGHRKQIYR
jgi:mRNA interferase RelE/StbE